MTKNHKMLLAVAAIALTSMSLNLPLVAQQVAPDAVSSVSVAALPDDPSASSSVEQQSQPQGKADQSASPASDDKAPPKRLFLVIPNFRNVSTTTVLPPQSVKDKFADATEDTFDYSAVLLALGLSSYAYGTNATPEFGTGAVGYGRYFWHAALDQVVENYFVEFIVPVVAHEDTRYYTLGHGGFLRRSGHSLGQIIITKSDKGRRTFNSGEIIGAAASSGVSEYYYPSAERSFGDFFGKYATNLIIDSASYFVREFYPEISRTIFRQKAAQ